MAGQYVMEFCREANVIGHQLLQPRPVVHTLQYCKRSHRVLISGGSVFYQTEARLEKALALVEARNAYHRVQGSLGHIWGQVVPQMLQVTGCIGF